MAAPRKYSQEIRVAVGHDLRHRFDAELDEVVRCHCGTIRGIR